MLIKRLVFIQMLYLFAKIMFEKLNLFIFYISPYIFEMKTNDEWASSGFCYKDIC